MSLPMIAISRTGRLLRSLVRVSCRRPVLTVALSLLLALLGAAVTVQGLRFKTSGRDVLPKNAGYVLRYVEYSREFGELEDIVVVVETRSFEAAKDYASRLVQELRHSPVQFPRASYRIDPKRFEGRQLLYLSTAKLREIRDKIFDHQEFMESFAADPSLAQLVEGVNRQLAAAFITNIFDLGLSDNQPTDTRFLRVLLEQIATRLDRPMPYRSPWGTLFSFGGEAPADAGYFRSDDKSLLFVLVETPEGQKGSFVGDQRAIDTIRSVIDRLRPVFPSVQAGVTGAPVLSNDEMSAAFQDSQVATVLAFALTLLVMTLAFWRVGKPLLMLVVLAVSLAWAMGVVTLTVGHLTIFSVMFISIVVGIGIDYGIYFLFRYEEEIFLGRNLKEALELTAARTGPGMLLGALTAGGTFYVLGLTDFRGIQELGFIAGSSILLAWVSMMTFFPALLVLIDRHHAARPRDQKPRAHELERIRVPILERLTRFPVTILVAAGALTAASVWALPSVGFDYNMLNLQAKGTESVAWEKRILATTGRSGFNGLASAGSLEELRRKQEAFERLPSVSEVDSVLHLIPEEQREKTALIKSFAPLVAPVKVARSSAVDVDRLTQAVRDLKRRLDLAASEAGDRLPKEVRQLREQTGALLSQLASADRELAEPALTHLQAQLYRDFVAKFHMLQRNLRPRPVELTDLPDELRRKFVGNSGRFLLQVHPKVDIWERAGAEQFVTELRSVDPDVTGAPIITYEAIRLMERAYVQGTAYAFILVGGLTFWMIRRVRLTLLALLPLGLGLLWTLGLMWVFDLKFTMANVWGLPLIIGTSAEFGLNIVMRYLEGREHGGPLVARSTVMAVALNGLTTIVGFGSLMMARHQGIFGLGLLLTLGSACGLLASLVVLPVVLRMLPRTGVRRQPAADTLTRSPAA
ncbi:MAG: MMPL family transporter [Candidatus Rokubacteria bacterium]|nr:MMPL family transporter [Candidatus Rokubacteria bacterium]